MNVIADILNMLRVRSTVYIGKNLAAPWGVHITEHESLARFHIVVAGSTWVRLEKDGDAVLLNEGDVAIAIFMSHNIEQPFRDGNLMKRQ